ncbi:MAG: gliding motility-associated C-terminal domain-containing protein [Bacteroidetes bacterium]|nr:gliding motility-associated C-terminal domain-containing protein [Bacteroidota bacterium]
MVRRLILVLLGLAVGFYAHGTHLRAGEITVTRDNCSGLTFTITITAYTNTGSPVKFSDGILDFGDGSTPTRTPTIDNTPFAPGIGRVVYTTTHTYAGAGYYVISYKERNRNAGILNMSNSVNTQFYLETAIVVDRFVCDNSPRLLVPPIDKGCSGAAWYHNPGAYDIDGDSLSYEFVVPKQDKNIPVGAYRYPDHPDLYTGIDYSRANEKQNGPPTFTINSRTGTILWDAPGAQGEYNIAFRIISWRKIAGTFVQLASVTRDMQIVIEDCLNKRPELKVPKDTCIVAGTILDESIFGTDPDFDPVTIEAFSQVFIVNPSPAVFYSPDLTKPNQAFEQPTSSTQDAVLKFRWATNCLHVKDQPYQVVFKISDRSGRGPSLVQFKTWNIKVIGPPPVWQSATVNVPTRSANLQWNSYACQNASSIEVYRRVGSFPYTPPNCVTGIPNFLGFTKIATLPANATQYTNTGLAAGAQYCYRLVAVFPLPQGGQSIVSQEICIPPFQVDKAVVTHVTVDKTSTASTNNQPLNDGQITVRWRSPFDANAVNFPKPFYFKIFRAEGFSGTIRTVDISPPGKFRDSTLVDNNIATRDVIYNYTVKAFANNDAELALSESASLVRLDAKPEFERIKLTWAAVVPWSNNTAQYPWHRIYRGPANATENQMVLIDSVNVNQKGFSYLDEGQYNNVKLQNGQEYCYKVMTRGSYGNPKIKAPQNNFSQITCAVPDDKVPPCKPQFATDLKGTDCSKPENTPCGQSNSFSNVIRWKRPFDPNCKLDIKSYNIYFSSRKGGEFVKLPVTVTDTVFEHKDLSSFAGCYKITAVDRAGNESDQSEEVCFDNCPYYELPNVFTPNGDKCNDVFSAYSLRIITEGNKTDCGNLTNDQVSDLQRRCARFVQKVIFTVYNRWGGVVYTYESGGEKTIYIDWDGRDNNKAELPAGTYYYEAQVTFNVVDPSKANKSIKGWVQIIR